MVDKAKSVTVDPVVTIYGPDGMIDQAARKAVDRMQGNEKPAEEYVTKEEHQKQLQAIISVAGSLFPGFGKMSIDIMGPELAASSSGTLAIATKTVIVPDVAQGTVVMMSAQVKGSKTSPAGSGSARQPTGKPQWWLKQVKESELKGSRKGYQVYVIKDSKGKVLYVGKSGGAGGVSPQTWEERIRAHIKDPTKKEWIGEADTISVTSELTEMEAFAAEESLINEFKAVSHNVDPGEFAKRFPQGNLAANTQSAATKPTVNFKTDIVP